MRESRQREQELFEQAYQLGDPQARRDLLDTRCAGDPALRSRIERLLALQERATTFLVPPPPSGVVG